MTAQSLMKNLTKRYSGEWVSVSEDYKKVYAHSTEASVLIKKIKSGNIKNIKNAIIVRIPAKIPVAYVG